MKTIDEIYRDFPDEERDRKATASSSHRESPRADKVRMRGSVIPIALFSWLFSCLFLYLVICAAVQVDSGSTPLAIRSSDRTAYTNAKYVMDTMERDLAGCLPADSLSRRNAGPTHPGGRPGHMPEEPDPVQSLWMDNGCLIAPGMLPSYKEGGFQTDRPGCHWSGYSRPLRERV